MDNKHFDNDDIIQEYADLYTCLQRYMHLTQKHKYSNKMKWMGIQSMQYPEDMFAIQDILWETKPDCIIATGVAKGGTLLFLSTIMHIYEEHPTVIGIDPYITEEEYNNIINHPAGAGIVLLKESSIDYNTAELVQEIIDKHRKNKIMILLDSNHHTEFVLTEMAIWSKLVSYGQYLIVGWTVIGESEDSLYKNKAWGKKSNPLIAVNQFLLENSNFKRNEKIENKYLIMSTGKGFLQRIK